MKSIIAAVAIFFLCAGAHSQTIYVPDDYPTIQGAIYSWTTKTTILVRPGVYNENLVFDDWDGVLKSTDGPIVTTIRGDGTQPAVWMTMGATVEGFTITNGSHFFGGGIYIHTCDPSIIGNVITGNHGEAFGGGVHIDMYSYPLLFNNLIYSNTASSGGGGVAVELYSDVVIRNNTIVNNSSPGLYCDDSTAALENVIMVNNGINIYTANGGSVSQAFSFIGAGDPLFVSGPLGDFYLSQVAAGQTVTSPCVDTGGASASSLGLDVLTTRSDEVGDEGVVDMGFHYTPATPTLVELKSFTAVGKYNKAIIKWVTASEIHCAGFRLWVRDPGQRWRLLTKNLIPSKGGPTVGGEYKVHDHQVKSRFRQYRLEEISLNGCLEFFGPIFIQWR